ncbi:DUF3017 domain-containing protein [Nonomuraea sp. NPDC046570]|uniref:DUF3017 domain-containing protein n=1 Tax=Nonomuraea sp. NPDC046570 TaxID=3155255 RepID=UPI00340F1CDB
MSLNDDRTRASWGPYPLILAGAALAVLGIFLIDLEWGGFTLGAVLMVGGALRFAGYGGQLAVRNEKIDAITLAVFGFALVITAMFLQYPQLKDLIVR